MLFLMIKDTYLLNKKIKKNLKVYLNNQVFYYCVFFLCSLSYILVISSNNNACIYISTACVSPVNCDVYSHTRSDTPCK